MGSIYALGCAFSWSLGVILFKKCHGHISPLGLNLIKNLYAAFFLGITMFLATGSLMPESSRSDLIILAVSGVLGIGIADGLFLICLNIIGASKTAMVECLYAPSIALFSALFIGEILEFYDAVGIFLVVGAVVLMSLKGGNSQKGNVPQSRVVFGIALGSLGVLAIALGVVIAKPVLARAHLIEVVTYRMVFGLIASSFVLTIRARRRVILREILHFPNQLLLITTSFVGTYLAIVLWLAGFKYSTTVTAATLNQMSTFITVGLAYLLLKEEITKTQVFATIIAATGALIVVL